MNCNKLLQIFKLQCYFFSEADKNVSDIFLLTVPFSKIIEPSYVTRLNAYLIFSFSRSAPGVSDIYLCRCNSTIFPLLTIPRAAVSWLSAVPAHFSVGLVILSFGDL